MRNLVIKGDIVFTKEKERFTIFDDSYLIVEDGVVKKICNSLENIYKDYTLRDYTGKIIIPGFVDIHLHAPQFPNRGLGLDKELIPWLNTYTFPEESKYDDLEYAKVVYTKVIKELWKYGTTRSVVFSSIFKESTKLLLDLFIESGLGAFVGKVNMDRNTSKSLTENTVDSLNDTEEIIKEYKDKSDLVKPIITPRFIPTCSSELLHGLGALAKKYNIPVQSHLNENKDEVLWVKELYPDSNNYASVYDDFGLFGQSKTIMAHCIYNTDEEIDLMKKRDVFVAHCPYSNFNLSSGIAPIRKYLNAGVNVGLASDISGGDILSIPRIIAGAIQASKMAWLYGDKNLQPLTVPESFYLGTKGGGKFFGNVGSFEEGYEFDALIIDVENLNPGKELTTEEKVQQYIYIGNEENIIERYVRGEVVNEPFKD